MTTLDHSTERTTWNFYSAGQLTFGCHSVNQLPRLLKEQSLKKLLIVSDRNLAEHGILDRVTSVLKQSSVTVSCFLEGEAEPSIALAEKGREFANDFQPDAILGLGGGSNIDLAKLIANLVTHGGKPSDYFGFDRIPGPVLPLICLPTTSGTGSEVSHAAVLTDTDSQMKVSTLSRYLRPALAIVDPLLTLTCPRSVTAESGIDALTHAIEAYTAIDYSQLEIPPDQSWPYDGKNPLGDSLAEKAIQLVGDHLVNAVNEPDNLEARTGMSLASTLAGLAFSNCAVAVVHALEYPIGGAWHCSHGAGNGLLLPYVMRFNLPVRIDAFQTIATLLGKEISNLDRMSAAESAVVAVEDLKSAIGIPQRLSELNSDKSRLPEFAEKAFEVKRLMSLNPRKPTKEDLLQILESAW